MRIPRAAAVLLLLGAVWLGAPGRRLDAQSACVVTTIDGEILGQDLGASCAFLGIPYAAPPTANNRWRPPQPSAPWAAPLRATTPPPNCPSIASGTPTGNEDCLKLNIWVAKSSLGTAAPVLVWLHTGSFVASSANFASHNGRHLTEDTGVIVVAPNYRLGPFGFLVHPALAAEDPLHPSSGNYGLMDQRAALAWVRDNIVSFGGDPDNVTLAGTSAGADSVGLHLVSPKSAALFQRAIVESGTPTIRWPTHAESIAQGEAVAAALGCSGAAPQVLGCLRAQSVGAILQALPQGAQQVTEPSGRVFWLPVIDGIELPDQPRSLFSEGAFERVPIILGTTRDEGWGFLSRSFPSGVDLAQYEGWVQTEFAAAAPVVEAAYPASAFPSPAEAMARVVGDAQFVCETRRLGRLIEQTRTPVFLYSYEHVIDAISAGHIIHGVESNIIFGNNYVPPQFPSYTLAAADLSLHSAMQGYWTRFAAAGDPNPDDDTEDVVHWPVFTHPTGQGRGAGKALVFDASITTRLRLREEACDVLEPFFLRSILGGVPASAP
jgi:para-nitrobenzyl esterase